MDADGCLWSGAIQDHLVGFQLRYHIYISVTHCIQKQKISSKYPVPWMHIELILKWDRNHSEKLEYKNDELHKSLLVFICGKI